jgi:hypothetical protein
LRVVEAVIFVREEDVPAHLARERLRFPSSWTLMRLCPVFHISGLPPSSAIRSYSAWLAFTSAMIVAPGSCFEAPDSAGSSS